MNTRTAVIIKGNPKFVDHNATADAFYVQIRDFLTALHYRVIFDAGEPYTSPEKADLWIGHSRGADRLRFAPPGTNTLEFGSSVPYAINHPDDRAIFETYPSDIEPCRSHYAFTDEMKQAIVDRTEQQK